MTQRVVSTHTIQETSGDHLKFLNICLKTVRHLSKELGNIDKYNLIDEYRWDKCDKGIKCNKCHTTVERLYHPDKYKRIFCDVYIYI